MEFSTFKLIFAIAFFVKVSSINEGDGDLVKMFASERKEMREEQKEMRADFRRENERLVKEDKNLHDKIDKQSQEIAKLNLRNNKQFQEIALLRNKLHHADLENKKANRQHDEKKSLEFEAKIQHAIRQERKSQSSELKDVVESMMKKSIGEGGQNNSLETELRKMINSEINSFMSSQKICVAGRYGIGSGRKYTTVEFHHTFKNKPAVSASLSNVYNSGGSGFTAYTEVNSVTKSSAVIYTIMESLSGLHVSWIACM